MASEAQIAANRRNAAASTGPRTEEGKARSSQNAVSFGLFATHDFIVAGEEDQYAALAAAMLKQLAPVGPLEEAFASEIMRASWRLHRCNAVESRFTNPAERDLGLDPMVNPATERTQNSLDRARAHAHRTLQRSIAELRALQTERRIRPEILPAGSNHRLGLASSRHIVPVLAKRSQSDTLPVSRNAPCPCGSGRKHKRCCGGNIAPVLSKAA